MKYRRVWLLFLLLLICSAPAHAQQEQAVVNANESIVLDLEALSTDELIELRDQIETELVRRGVISYFDLELNSKGDDVAALQKRLQELGYYVGNITGKYDSATRQAEKQFEKRNNLENDGVASQADQQVLFSDAAVPKITAVPKNVASPAPDMQGDPEVNPDEYGVFDYEDTMRFPENHRGEKVKLSGKVIQVLGSKTMGFQVRFSIGGGSDVVYVYINDMEYNILENDRLTIYAEITGIKTYTSIFNQAITIPSLRADCVILKN